MIKKTFFLSLFLLLSFSSKAQWDVKTEKDSMTDEISHTISLRQIKNSSEYYYFGFRCSGYKNVSDFAFGGDVFFPRGSRKIMFRFDSNPPKTFIAYNPKHIGQQIEIPVKKFLPYLLAEGNAKQLTIRVDDYDFKFESTGLAEALKKCKINLNKE